MKFSVVHKISTYLMSMCAFLALALSDELPPLAILLGGAGVVASWYWEAPRVRIERWTMAWNVLAVAAFALTVLAAFTSGQVVVPGAEFLLFLLVAKLFNRRTSRDYQWIYVLTFLMLVAGTTLNAEVSYAICFLGYVIAATWALILFHLRREMEDNFLLKHSDDSSSERVEVERILSSRRIVGPKFLVATASVSLVIFLLSAVLFLIFPRVGFGLFFQRAQSRFTFAGFSENGVELGKHGLIRTDPTVVMRVKITDPRFQGSAAPELHWRGVAFDHYARSKWTRSGRAFGTDAKVDNSHGGRTTTVRLPSAQQFGRLAAGLRQEIYLEPLDTPTLFAASTPLAFEIAFVSPMGAHTIGSIERNDEVRLAHSAGLRYIAYSDPRRPDPARLAAAPDADPKRFAPYLQLPAELPPRVIELAQRLTAGKTSSFAKAEAILAYLRKDGGYRYTLLMQEPPQGQEPLDFFLFDRKMGHCEYFSTAMAILLRAAGVPTRNTDGFVGGEWNEAGYIAVRSGDAHSWVEVWFQGVGWVTYDPTPAGLAQPLSRGGGSALDRLRRMLDALRLQWFKWVIDYDLGRQLNLMKSIGGFFSGGNGDDARRASEWLKERSGALTAAVLGGAALAGAVIFALRRRRRGAPGRGGRRAADPPIVVEYLRAARALAGRGFARAEAQTPREHAAQLAARGAPGARPYAALTQLYYDARYAGTSVELGEARRLAAAVREELRRAKSS